MSTPLVPCLVNPLTGPSVSTIRCLDPTLGSFKSLSQVKTLKILISAYRLNMSQKESFDTS